MKKKKLKQQLKKLDKRVRKIENQKHNIQHIGFDYLSNQHDDNEFDDEGY